MTIAQPALWLIAAILAQGALALGLLWYLGTIRIPMVMRGEVRIDDIALERKGWPKREWQASNAFDNQFQLPVLFYIGAGLALYFGPTLFEVVLAWLFVVSRYIHAFVHVTDNHVIRRFAAYFAGLLLLCVYWLDLLVRLVLAL
ncbi:MAG TPA: MAPEG family protein [Devosia sp.]|uniref:MAPEG family protein n=1 Tax=Devosia sp. TaxID=1871048 RepID=UPI002DDD77DF|nr:MAPEG family protein [Devosia sp.]HEV2517540.1 MAPEG family protein [Devosia sp.]